MLLSEASTSPKQGEVFLHHCKQRSVLLLLLPSFFPYNENQTQAN